MKTTDLSILDKGIWLNPPPAWELTPDGLTLETSAGTDFWRETLYGFRRDSGHALLVPVSGDFTATVTFEGSYEVLYDQAGLMLRRDGTRWLKAGIEFCDGMATMSVVITRGVSDWSTTALRTLDGPQRIRLTRLGQAVVVQFRAPSNRWQLLRVADVPATEDLSIGPMACSPERAGFKARFTEVRVGPPAANVLHDDSPAD